MFDITIRPANIFDSEQILLLCQEHSAYERAEYNSKDKLKLIQSNFFESDRNVKCIVAEQTDILVGYATFMKQFSSWDANFYVYLDCLYLQESIRGKGIGSLIMSHVRNYAEDENCKIIQWQTPDFNKDAIKFYRKIGATSKTKERFFLNI